MPTDVFQLIAALSVAEPAERAGAAEQLLRLGPDARAAAVPLARAFGDLNADEGHLGELGRLPNIAHAIAGVKTNTRRTKSYDNIVLDARNTTEYTGHSGVFDLMAEFDITTEQALDVSDHMPVWAEFSVFESGGGAVIATRPGQGTR